MNIMLFVGIGLAVIAHAIIGMLWYSPKFFGMQWMQLAQVKPDIAKFQQAIMGSLLAALIMAIGMTYFMQRLAIHSFADAFCFGIMAWLAFVATSKLSDVLWNGKPVQLFYITAGCSLVSIVAMAMILSLFM